MESVTRTPALLPAAWFGRLRNQDSTVFTLRVVLATRLIVWVAGLAAIVHFGENVSAWLDLDPAGVTAPFHSLALDKLLAPGARWDSVWYLSIAQHGYATPASANFFPLYPLLISIGAHLFGSTLVSGIVISVVSMLAGMMLLYRLARLDLDEHAARLTVLLLALFPTSLFFSAVYTTSLFLMLSVAAIYAARREQWALAGLCGGLTAATRPNGILLFLPLVMLYLYGPRVAPPAITSGAWWRPRFPVSWSISWLALVPAGLAAYLGYLAVVHGAPLAPYRAASVDWGHVFAGPFGAVVRTLVDLPDDLRGLVTGNARAVGPGDPLSWNARDLIDLGFLAFAVAGLLAAWRRLPMAYIAYAFVSLAQALSFPPPHEPMIGFSRYLLPIFPLFMGVAARLSGRRALTSVVLGVSAVLLAVFSGLWAYWALVP
jgi:hypothetical protein